MDKKAKLEQSIVEEQVYAKLWMLDGEKKAQRERNEIAEKKKKAAETVNILTWQTGEQEKAAEIARQKKVQE